MSNFLLKSFCEDPRGDIPPILRSPKSDSLISCVSALNSCPTELDLKNATLFSFCLAIFNCSIVSRRIPCRMSPNFLICSASEACTEAVNAALISGE